MQSDDFSDVAIEETAETQAIELEAEGEIAEAERVKEEEAGTTFDVGKGEFGADTVNQLSEDRDKALHRDVSKAEASKKLLESYDYVLS